METHVGLDASRYLQHLSLSTEERQNASRQIQEWDDLRQWLSSKEVPPIQPRPNRRPIITPSVATIHKAGFVRDITSTVNELGNSDATPEWPEVVERRRRVSLVVTLSITLAMTLFSAEILQAQHITSALRTAYLLIYAAMTYFMVSSFSKLVIGFWHASRGAEGNPWHPSHRMADPSENTRVAILFPVFHEDVARVGAGMAATAASLNRHAPHEAHRYDFFLLSDSRQVAYRIAEEAAVHTLKKECGFSRFYYRWRPSNDNAKLGNITDFCRRWGQDYKYMVVMDADSLMSGQTISQLLRMMEGNSRIGILQTNPTPILRKSLFGRMQQFAGRLYGTAFSYSLQAMYMGHASYIGHNAMIRSEPFIRHCMLPELPGLQPWGGKPLSHDIVEAAMMAKAGYEVWFLPELQGSYEEIPANMLGFLIRERRWMQGNLQHARFFFWNGLHRIHRENFVHSVMGYVSAPLWAIFLVISAWSMTSYLQSGQFSVDTISHIEVPSIMMLFASMVFLFLPRILAIAVNFTKNRASGYGGKLKILVSTGAETVFSFFFSAIVMAYITRFFWLWVKRRTVSWGTQQRDDAPILWSEAFRYFGWVSALGLMGWYLLLVRIESVPEQATALLASASGGWLNPESVLVWFFPILGGLTASVVLARMTSRRWALLERLQLFTIPEEQSVPQEIKDLHVWQSFLENLVPDATDPELVANYAVRDCCFFVWHRANTRRLPRIKERIMPLIQSGTPMTETEFYYALQDRSCFDEMHRKYASLQPAY